MDNKSIETIQGLLVKTREQKRVLVAELNTEYNTPFFGSTFDYKVRLKHLERIKEQVDLKEVVIETLSDLIEILKKQ